MMWGLGCKAQWLFETLSAELISLIGAIVLICVEDRPISATHGAGKVETRCAPTCRRQGRVKCSLRSNTEPKQPNSGRSSPGHLEKFLSPSRHESDSMTVRGHGRMERAGHGAEGLF